MKKTTHSLKRLLISSAAVAASLQFLTGCVTHAPERISDQSTQAVLWLQNSGEYQALCYQAFNAAKDAVDQAKASQTKPWAVVVDLDETMLDNSPYAAWLLHNQDSYASATWTAWCEAAEAPAIPGALEFAKYVIAQGGALFYVSNRSDEVFDATVKNLQALGFPEPTANRVFLKTDTSNKQARFQKVTDAGYEIVLMIGDNLNDFPEIGTWHQANEPRNQATASYQSAFGQRFIVLPNPSYGDWEAGMAADYHALSAKEKLQVRRESLQAWSGSAE
ncbi:MAG: 5'-nucleotidase, lipoprotein e(P4) family [Puniceicoccaceae bacterium]|nr:5'-nucleotidase, lipoprotein e(P4) family [Puniceicoccaceae bacterium]